MKVVASDVMLDGRLIAGDIVKSQVDRVVELYFTGPLDLLHHFVDGVNSYDDGVTIKIVTTWDGWDNFVDSEIVPDVEIYASRVEFCDDDSFIDAEFKVIDVTNREMVVKGLLEMSLKSAKGVYII